MHPLQLGGGKGGLKILVNYLLRGEEVRNSYFGWGCCGVTGGHEILKGNSKLHNPSIKHF